MHRPYVTCAAFLFACAAIAAGAQQANPSNPPANQDQYQGQSNPPADDPINVAPSEQQGAPIPRPPAGHRDVQPAQQAPAVEMSRPTSVDPSANFPNPQGDDSGVVEVAPDSGFTPLRHPQLKTRGAYSAQPPSARTDPDGDIVHHEPLPPGVLAEGAKIRAR